MSDDWNDRPPMFFGSKLAALFISGVLYTGVLFMVYVVGCQEVTTRRPDDKLVKVKFVEPVPRTLAKEKVEGADPTKKPEPVPEVVPPRAEPAPQTEVKTDEDERVPAGPPTESTPVISAAAHGVGQTGLIGDRSQGGRAEGVHLHGGSGASENAVEAALRWLGRHQDDDGKWDYINYVRHCPPGDVCIGQGQDAHTSLPGGPNIAVTGLSLLAFLGAGNTPQAGDYHERVDRGFKWLLSVQNEHTGAFNQGTRSTSIYNQAIATLALAECYAMTQDIRLRPRLVRAVGFLVQCQQKSGGWDYTEAPTNRSDTSVTGWVVMALKSASAAGVDIPYRTVFGVKEHFESVTSGRGYTGYTSESGTAQQMGLNAVGMLSRIYLGYDTEDPVVRKQAALLLDDLPAWHKLRGPNRRHHTEYYWYYGTLAMYQMGGREWAVWNASMRDMLITAQCTDGDRSGSWDPDGHWARNYAGRVYSTALCALNLEIYYRYLPLNEVKGGLGLERAFAERIRNEPDPGRRIALLRQMQALADPTVDKTLKELLNDEDTTVRFTAAKDLAERGDPGAIPFLVKALGHQDDFVRFGAVRALGNIDTLQTVPPLIEALTDPLPGNARLAAELLRTKTGVNFGFDENADATERARVQAAWRSWWENNRRHLTAEPPVTARVLAAPDRGQRVLVKLVAGGPFQVGMRLRVYRAGKIVGYVEIQRVMEAGMAEGATLDWTVREPIGTTDQLKSRTVGQGAET